MKRKGKPEFSVGKVLVNLVVILSFSGALLWGILYLSKGNTGREQATLEEYATQFASSVTNTHWRWQANDKPNMVLLVHYDKEGKERGRTPVPMNHIGWPLVEPNREGCVKTWRKLMNMSPMVDGFRVIGDYYSEDETRREDKQAFCRYRLSSGSAFDYVIGTGEVIYLGDG